MLALCCQTLLIYFNYMNKAQGTYKHILGGEGVGVVLSNVVWETKESIENYLNPSKCSDPDLMPDCRGDKVIH